MCSRQASYYEPLPLLLFGGLSMVAGLLSLLLPETFNRKLPDTVSTHHKYRNHELTFPSPQVEEAIALGNQNPPFK